MCLQHLLKERYGPPQAMLQFFIYIPALYTKTVEYNTYKG